MILFMAHLEAKISIKQDFKSQNLGQFLRFGSNFLQVSSILRQVKLLYTDLGSDRTPSLISDPQNMDPLPGSVKAFIFLNNTFFTFFHAPCTQGNHNFLLNHFLVCFFAPLKCQYFGGCCRSAMYMNSQNPKAVASCF